MPVSFSNSSYCCGQPLHQFEETWGASLCLEEWERERKTPPCVFHYLCIAHCYRSFTDEATFGADRVHFDLELELHELIKGSVGLGSVMKKRGQSACTYQSAD